MDSSIVRNVRPRISRSRSPAGCPEDAQEPIRLHCQDAASDDSSEPESSCSNGKCGRTAPAPNWPEALFEKCRQQLNERGIFVTDELFGDGGETADRLRLRALDWYSSGLMQSGIIQRTVPEDGKSYVTGVGKLQHSASSGHYRGDYVRWLNLLDGDADETDCIAHEADTPVSAADRPLLMRLLMRVSRLVWRAVDRNLCPSLIMASVYPPGKQACFKQHVDSPSGEGRILTAILYTNKSWRKEDGALLLAQTAGKSSQNESVELLPQADRLVIFHSEHVMHEVTPNVHPSLELDGHRCAFTIWYHL